MLLNILVIYIVTLEINSSSILFAESINCVIFAIRELQIKYNPYEEIQWSTITSRSSLAHGL